MAEVSKLSVKGQIVNILGFAGHSVCVAVSHLCSCSAKAALNHMQTNGTVWLSSHKILFIKTVNCQPLLYTKVNELLKHQHR